MAESKQTEARETKLLQSRFMAARTDRASEEAVWDEVEKFVMPLGQSGRGDAQATQEWKRIGLWDFTAVDGNQKLAANLHTTVTPSGLKWAKFSWRDKSLLDDVDAMEWLENTEDRAFAALIDSDFATEAASGYQEYGAYGNMWIVAEVVDDLRWRGLDFTNVPLREGYGIEDSRGGLLEFYRHLRWTAAQIVERSTQADGTILCPQRIIDAAKREDGGVTKIDVIFAIHRRDEGKPATDLIPVVAPEDREWSRCYFLLDSGEEIGAEGGYYEMPAFLARYERTARSMYGHGPGVVGISTIKYLNSWCELLKLAQAKAVEPTTFTTEFGLLGTPTGGPGDVDWNPGAVNIGRSKDDVWTHESQSNFRVGENTVNDLRAMVRQLFHVDELQLKDSPAMTATEAQIRYELMNRVMGATMARLKAEFLDPLLKLVVSALMRAGQLKPLPQSVVRSMEARAKAEHRTDSKLDIDIEYQGPLARAQRTDEVAAIERLSTSIVGMAEFFPEVRDVFDPVKAVREIGKRLGVPATVLNSQDEVEKKGKERAALQERMAQAEAARAEGEAGQQLADAAGAASQLPVNLPGMGAPTITNSPATPPLMPQ